MTPTIKASLWMLGSVTSFTIMAVSGREAGQSLDTFEIMFYRSVVGVVIVVAVLAATRQMGVIRLTHLKSHTLRNVVHFSGQNLWFFALTAAPLAQVVALEFTTPLWVILFSPFMVGERITRMRAICALIGFVGILIVARPSVDSISPGLLAAAGAAVFFGLTYMMTKRLTRHESIGAIMFWLTFLQVWLGLVAAGYDGDIAWPSAQTMPIVIVIALAGLMAHFCITNALALAPASVVAPVEFFRLPAVAIVAMLVYQEVVDIWVFVGAIIIFGANYLNILTESRRKRIANSVGV